MATTAQKHVDPVARDLARHALKSLWIFLLAFIALASNLLGWLSMGLSLVTGKLSEGSFALAKYLSAYADRLGWRVEDKVEKESKQ